MTREILRWRQAESSAKISWVLLFKSTRWQAFFLPPWDFILISYLFAVLAAKWWEIIMSFVLREFPCNNTSDALINFCGDDVTSRSFRRECENGNDDCGRWSNNLKSRLWTKLRFSQINYQRSTEALSLRSLALFIRLPAQHFRIHLRAELRINVAAVRNDLRPIKQNDWNCFPSLRLMGAFQLRAL